MLQESAEPTEAPDSTTATVAPDLIDEIDAVADITDRHKAAEAVFERLEASGRLRLLVGPLAHAIANHRRNHVRELEHQTVAEAEQIVADTTKPDPETPVRTRRRRTARRARRTMPTLRDLLGESFFTGQRWVRYNEAVAEDYRDSVAYLRGKVDGLERTVSFRTMCARVIEAHPGARTLADVPDEVLADVLGHRA